MMNDRNRQPRSRIFRAFPVVMLGFPFLEVEACSRIERSIAAAGKVEVVGHGRVNGIL